MKAALDTKQDTHTHTKREREREREGKKEIMSESAPERSTRP